VAFLVVPDLIMRALFMRGKFTAADAHAAAMTLAAYSIGLFPFVLMRSVTATFLARGDTARPVKAALTAAAVNIAFKVAFLYFTALAQVGLALATSIGTWINFALVVWFATRAGLMHADRALMRALGKLAAAGVALAVALVVGQWIVTARNTHDIVALIVLAVVGGCVYAGAILALFGPRWLAALARGDGANAPLSGSPPSN
jgi:putative peptidoglycan lipid II flippase